MFGEEEQVEHAEADTTLSEHERAEALLEKGFNAMDREHVEALTK